MEIIKRFKLFGKTYDFPRPFLVDFDKVQTNEEVIPIIASEWEKDYEILKILKKKRVNLQLLDLSIFEEEATTKISAFKHYNSYIPYKTQQLNRQEFNILKEWLKENGKL